MKDIKKTVVSILTCDEKARNSDRYLYIQVVKRYCPQALDMRLEDAFLTASLPNTESVRRARQWAQAKYSYLRPSENVANYRELNEERYREEFK